MADLLLPLIVTFPVCTRCNVSVCKSRAGLCNFIKEKLECQHWSKLGGKKKRLTHLTVMLGGGPRRKWFSAGEYDALWWHHAAKFGITECVFVWWLASGLKSTEYNCINPVDRGRKWHNGNLRWEMSLFLDLTGSHFKSVHCREKIDKSC